MYSEAQDDTMSEYAEAVQRLRSVITFLERNSIKVPRTEFTSTIGEWLVMDQLLQQGYSPTLQSGQYDVDILLKSGDRVEVKAATWDSDFGGVYRFDRIKPEKLDHLVCVTLLDDYSEAEYFVFSDDDINSLPPRNQTAFNDPERVDNQRLVRILDNPEDSDRQDMKDINDRLDEFLNAWNKIPPV